MLLTTTALVLGQGVTGTILGTVFDDSGSVIPGARISVINTGTTATRSAQTDEKGNYIVTALPVGSYRVEITQEGFKTFASEGIVLEVNQNVRIDGHLVLGEVAESIEVTADAAHVDSYQTQVGTMVDTNRVK